MRNNMLARTALAVFLMAGYLSAYLTLGTLGLVMLALAVLLILSHPFLLTGWRHRETKRLSDREKYARSEPSATTEEAHARQF